jgi:FtsP/CotA-like multicopper oxidase with cupredoxin domain
LTLPRPEFEVEPEAKYRFRVINAGSLFCPVQISVDNHTLTLIAADGRAFAAKFSSPSFFLKQAFKTASLLTEQMNLCLKASS